jgi:hypothetical protein
MERGFVVDEGYGTVTVGDWVAGEPVKSFWAGLKLKGRTRLSIATWRCRRCGFLESYAPDSPR